MHGEVPGNGALAGQGWIIQLLGGCARLSQAASQGPGRSSRAGLVWVPGH